MDAIALTPQQGTILDYLPQEYYRSYRVSSQYLHGTRVMCDTLFSEDTHATWNREIDDSAWGNRRCMASRCIV